MNSRESGLGKAREQASRYNSFHVIINVNFHTASGLGPACTYAANTCILIEVKDEQSMTIGWGLRECGNDEQRVLVNDLLEQ